MSFQPINDDTLLAYADGALDPQRRAEVEALLGDPGLRAEAEALQRLQGGLRATFGAADRLPAPSPAVWGLISRRVARPGRRRLNLALGGGVTALIVIAFAVLLSQRRPPATGVAPTPIPTTSAPRAEVGMAQDRIEVPSELHQGTLAYICGGQLCVLDTITGEQRQLTSGAEQVSAPAWSPDGTSILYIAEAPQGRELRRYDAATGQASTIIPVEEDAKFQVRARANWLGPTRQIVDMEYTEPTPGMDGPPRGVWMATMADGGADSGFALGWAEPHLAPDGRSVVFVDFYAGNGAQQLKRRLLPDGTTQSIGSFKLSPASADTSYHWPTFSPDSTRVAYLARSADGTVTIHIVGADGAGDREVVTFPNNLPLKPDLQGLAWSPDGSFLAVSLQDAGGRHNINFFSIDHHIAISQHLDGAQPAWTSAPAARAALLDDSDPRRPTIAAVPPTAAPTTPTPQAPPMPDIPIGALPSGQIAFTALHGAAGGGCGSLGVYILEAGASQPAYLAQGCTPLLSPDGKLVAYERIGHIYVIPADGGQEINISGDGMVDNTELPSWSPDSRRLAFATDWNNHSEFYLVDADGSNRTRIMQGPAAWGAGRGGINLLWSPDGRRLAFTVSEDANWDIYVVDIDGRHLTRLTDDPARDGVIAWSPDGRRLLFWSERDDGTTDISVMNADGSEQALLASSYSGGQASWSLDGKQIAFASGRDGQLYVISADGGRQRRLTDLPIHVVNQIWSRDGQYIIFGAFSADWEKGALFAIRTDGGQLIRLTSPAGWLQWAQR